jgi:hypothetical protein
MVIFGEQDSTFSHIARLLGGTSYKSSESVLASLLAAFFFLFFSIFNQIFFFDMVEVSTSVVRAFSLKRKTADSRSGSCNLNPS